MDELSEEEVIERVQQQISTLAQESPELARLLCLILEEFTDKDINAEDVDAAIRLYDRQPRLFNLLAAMLRVRDEPFELEAQAPGENTADRESDGAATEDAASEGLPEHGARH